MYKLDRNMFTDQKLSAALGVLGMPGYAILHSTSVCSQLCILLHRYSCTCVHIDTYVLDKYKFMSTWLL